MYCPAAALTETATVLPYIQQNGINTMCLPFTRRDIASFAKGALCWALGLLSQAIFQSGARAESVGAIAVVKIAISIQVPRVVGVVRVRGARIINRLYPKITAFRRNFLYPGLSNARVISRASSVFVARSFAARIASARVLSFLFHAKAFCRMGRTSSPQKAH